MSTSDVSSLETAALAGGVNLFKRFAGNLRVHGLGEENGQAWQQSARDEQEMAQGHTETVDIKASKN